MTSGALEPLLSREVVVVDGGVPFLVRQLDSLQRKARAVAPLGVTPTDPFCPWDPALYVGAVSSTHVALLNKFNVLEEHLLIVTVKPEPQTQLVTLEDWRAWYAGLSARPSLGFYNGGKEAGASQPHKHLQLVPLPLGRGVPGVPIAPWLASATGEEGLDVLADYPVHHAFARLSPSGEQGLDAEASFDAWCRLARAAGLGDPRQGEPQRLPYDLLATTDWLLVVPRRRECVLDTSLNALAFAGSLLVKDARRLSEVRARGPVSLLQAAAFPVGHVPSPHALDP